MAKLSSKPAPGRWWTGSADPRPYMDQVHPETEEDLKKLEEESRKATPKNPVGFLLSFPVADGRAIYRVAKTDPLTLEHVPYGDQWQIAKAHIRGIKLSDVLAMMQWDSAFEKLRARQAGKAKKPFGALSPERMRKATQRAKHK